LIRLIIFAVILLIRLTIINNVIFSSLQLNSLIAMFDTLNEIRTAWDESHFILVSQEHETKDILHLVIPSQSVHPFHISEMRRNAGGLVYVTIPYEFGRALELPYQSVIYRAIASRYPVIGGMLTDHLPETARGLSISLDHIDAPSGIPAIDSAKTINALADLVDDHSHKKLVGKSLFTKLVNSFRIPGHVPVLRGSSGLLRKQIGITELSLALCEITNQAPCTTICMVMDEGNGGVVRKAVAKFDDYPLVDAKTIVNLWRSIKKVSREDIAS
jgi:3,4-dihydroxy 2-butanone 4-phosphate synthase